MADAICPFHLAFPVDDLAAARAFYSGVLGCREGRSAPEWIDFDLYGHQIVAHLDSRARPRTHANPVDGHDVPVPHFGRSEGHTSELPSLMRTSYAVFYLNNKKK